MKTIWSQKTSTVRKSCFVGWVCCGEDRLLHNNCMLFRGVDRSLNQCKFCETKCYKNISAGSRQKHLIVVSQMHYFLIILRLKSCMHLELLQLICIGMTHRTMMIWWYIFLTRLRGSISAIIFPEFASEIINVKLDLCTNDFQYVNKYSKQYFVIDK